MYGAAALDRALDEHRAALAQVMAVAGLVPPEREASPRAPAKWSPAQEVAHLVRVCRELVAILEGQPDYDLLVPPERAARLYAALVPRILTQPWWPVGAVAPERISPPADPGPLREQVESLRRLEPVFEAAIRRAVEQKPDRRYMHPYFGPMPLIEMVSVLARHAVHHAGLIRSSLTAVPAP